MPEGRKQIKFEGKILRDNKGNIIDLEGFPENSVALLVPFIADLNASIKEFNKASRRYSKALISLTIVLAILALCQFLVFISG